MGAVEDMRTDPRKIDFLGCRLSSSESKMLGEICKKHGNITSSEMIRELIRKEHNKFYSPINETKK